MHSSSSIAPGAAAVPAGTHAAEPLVLGWRQPRGLIGLSVVNYLLRILTLGIYHFWGKTEVRKRIWSAVRINGEPLEYTGTGKELFIGFLVVFGGILLPVTLGSLAVIFAFGPESAVVGLYQILLYVAFFFLAGVGLYRAQRYRLSRTRWRGIRGGMEEASWSYGWTYFWTAALIPLTLGWIVPWRATTLQKLLTSRMRFGSKPLRFDARADPLYVRYAGLWLGSIFIMFLAGGAITALGGYMLQTGQLGPGRPPSALYIAGFIGILAVAYLFYGIVSAWYRAGQINHFAAHTHFEGATFKGTATAPSLIWLAVTNFLMVILTLGLLVPVAQARSARYLAERLSISGDVDLTTIAQGANTGLTRGEGLAQAFDIDAF